jgi:Mg-chelatase subunit ChlD
MFTNNKTETEIVVVLDRSGSMSSIIDGTLNGFNTFLKEQQSAAGVAFITLVQFDDRYQVDYKSVNSKLLAPLSVETYIPRGTTALYDAIGQTINGLGTARDVIFVIITDGLENASREFKADNIKKMIEKQTGAGWKFIFLGANQDAVLTGEALGVSQKMSMTYTASDIGANNAFAAMSSNATKYRGAKLDGLESMENLSFSADQRTSSVEGEK